MNLNAMFVGIFVFFIMFSVLFVTMPSGFILLGVGVEVQDKEAADYFNAQNVTMYNYTLGLNLSYPEAKSYDFGLPAGQKIEFWWCQDPLTGVAMFQVRHLTKEWWWWAYHRLAVQEPYAGDVLWPSQGLFKEDILELWDEGKNASYCEFACEHIPVKLFIFTFNQSWTLEESYDNGKLNFYTSYDIDWTQTGTNMWTVMGQLLSFQNPQLGVPGTFGQILGAGISGVLWACIAILFYALITSLIPFISGWRGD